MVGGDNNEEFTKDLNNEIEGIEEIEEMVELTEEELNQIEGGASIRNAGEITYSFSLRVAPKDPATLKKAGSIKIQFADGTIGYNSNSKYIGNFNLRHVREGKVGSRYCKSICWAWTILW